MPFSSMLITPQPAKPRRAASDTSAEIASPNTFTAGASNHLLHLQGIIGNRALRNMLQRQETPEDEGGELAPAGPDTVYGGEWLPPDMVETALQFYARYADEFTPAILVQIRSAVNRTGDGPMTADDVQAVAHWQVLHHIRDVDGIASSRTLAAMFPDGLAEQDDMESYLQAADAVLADWATLTAAERLDRLTQIANERLIALGVYPITAVSADDLDGDDGRFNSEAWLVRIHADLLADELPVERQRVLVSVIDHETRHAEQAYQIARLLAGQGRSAAWIRRHTAILDAVIDQAVTDPMPQGEIETIIAQDWYRSTFGNREDYTDETYREMRATQRAIERAERAYDADPTPRNERRLERLRARADRLFERYRDLTREHDAHYVDDGLERLQAQQAAEEAAAE